MRILVTGGAGFIGSAFVRHRLATTDDSVTVIDKLTYAGNEANLDGLADDPSAAGRYRFVQGDIADASLVATLIEDRDAIVNLAAETHVDRSILDATAFLRTGVMGLHAILEATRAEGERRGEPSSIRFLQVSTDEVYGSVEEGWSVETDRLDPRSPYSAAKAAGELLAGAYHATHGIDVIVSRGSNTYGPRQHLEKLVPLFITNAIADQPLPLYGDGLHRRSWLHVDDHAAAISTILDHGLTGEAYNVTSREECTNRQVTAAILDVLGKPWSLVRSVPDRPGHDRRYAMDGTKLALLGWRPHVPFDEGIRRTVAWYRDEAERWSAAHDADWHERYRMQYGWRLERSFDA